jgi:putrescine-ornithine antiporter
MALMAVSCFGAIMGWQFTLSRVFKSCAEAGFFPKVFARVNRVDSPVRGIFILLALQAILALMTTDESLNEQFAQLVNLAVVTNVFPYILCCVAVNKMLSVEGASVGLRRLIYVMSAVAIAYDSYAIYACGAIPVQGGASVILFGYVAYQAAFHWRPRLVKAIGKSSAY